MRWRVDSKCMNISHHGICDALLAGAAQLGTDLGRSGLARSTRSPDEGQVHRLRFELLQAQD
jgi:hypothetical protein